MQTVQINDFSDNLLKYLEIANSGEQIFVTSDNKLLAIITAPENQKELARQQLASTTKIHDVTSPIHSQWDALS